MTHVPVALAPSRHPARARRQTVPNEGLRPARGILVGLGLSSLIWTAVVALIAF